MKRTKKNTVEGEKNVETIDSNETIPGGAVVENTEVKEATLSDVSTELEKKQLEKKYYNQKKNVKTKIFEAEKNLNVEIPAAEQDLAEVLEKEPGTISDEDVNEFKKTLESQKKQLINDIELLQAHEKTLELDYEDLKTEPREERVNEYAKTVNHMIKINAPLMKMIFDYFNSLNDNQEYQEKSKIIIDCFLNERGIFSEGFPHNTNMDAFNGSVMVNFRNDIRVIVTLKKYIEQNQFQYRMSFTSEGKTYLNPDYLGKKILFNAISHSKIKGSYITLPADSIMWKIEKLEKRSFSDIFLPKTNMQELEMYTTLFSKTGKLLRYLMIGSPGTGKTESTLAIANDLKDQRVTIIKTMVCDSLREKVELAELLAPSLIILDDIDLTIGSRKKGMVSSGLQQFLDVADGTEKIRPDVGIIATTNSLELLDMAAQRPGRFDRLLSFDSLTKKNIKNIILKSMNRNFDLNIDSPEVLSFIDTIVVECFHKALVTGAHIYNTVKMLYLRVETLGLGEITAKWIVSEIKEEIAILNKIRNTDYLKEKMSGNASSEIGFPQTNDTRDDDDETEYDKEESIAGSSLSFQAIPSSDDETESK